VHKAWEQQQEVKRRTEDGQWGSTGDAEGIEERMQTQLESIGQHMGGEVQTIRMEYDALFLGLLQVLNEQCSLYTHYTLLQVLNAKGAGSENLRFLAFRLDFNEYYKDKAAKAVAAS
jgi:hypothetical protein